MWPFKRKENINTMIMDFLGVTWNKPPWVETLTLELRPHKDPIITMTLFMDETMKVTKKKYRLVKGFKLEEQNEKH